MVSPELVQGQSVVEASFGVGLSLSEESFERTAGILVLTRLKIGATDLPPNLVLAVFGVTRYYRLEVSDCS